MVMALERKKRKGFQETEAGHELSLTVCCFLAYMHFNLIKDGFAGLLKDA